jgi:transposase
MSTSLLYHGFGVRGYELKRTRYEEGVVEFEIDLPRERWRCSACGGRTLTAHGRVPNRRWQTVPIGGKQVWLRFDVPRIECHGCGVTRQVAVHFAEPRKSYTRALARYVLELLRSMTIQDVAHHVCLSWDTVKEIQKTYLLRHFAKPALRHLRQLAIDELAIGKGHRYVTVVLDIDRQRVVYVGEGKGAAALDDFWKRLKASGAKIQAVATDLSKAYLLAVMTHLPKAKHVADPFHIVKLMNEKLSELRRLLYHELTDKLHQKVLKGTRWLLLKNPENLDPRRNERQRLQEALQLNEPLALGYYLKEDLRQLWDQPDRQTALVVLNDWIRRAMASCIGPFQKMASTLALVRTSVLNHYRYPISTGLLENTNNKIQLLRRRAYGYRDQEFFKLKIYALHTTKYALVG